MMDIQKIIDSFELATETPTTFELVGARLSIKNPSVEDFKDAGLDTKEARLIGFSSMFKIEETIGPYITKEYFDMFEQLEVVSKQLEKDPWTRQAVIMFKPLHCFQSIQFLIREDGLKVIATMRSCNIDENLLTDIFLLHFCSVLIKQLCTNKEVEIIMNIGSLHRFKKVGV